MSTSYEFQGWLGLDPGSAKGNMNFQDYEPKTWEETDIDIKQVFSLTAKGCKIGGSAIGAPHEIEEMLELTVKKEVKPWVQKRSLKDVNQAVVDMGEGKARYRYVLVNQSHAKM
ncbi:hypothetical protein ABVK25_000981 [Lepraria finkii]|uniref:Uncharacterized protein n=1 Tax=Lepraria finkii TaxID=1340010 RepID=A0ABR4BPL4_9LECA